LNLEGREERDLRGKNQDKRSVAEKREEGRSQK
jgi:hypothetical protein